MLVPSELEELHTPVLPAPEVIFQMASSLSIGLTHVPWEGCYCKDCRAHSHRLVSLGICTATKSPGDANGVGTTL